MTWDFDRTWCQRALKTTRGQPTSNDFAPAKGPKFGKIGKKESPSPSLSPSSTLAQSQPRFPIPGVGAMAGTVEPAGAMAGTVGLTGTVGLADMAV